MLLSQSLNYEGDVEDFVLQITRHRRLSKLTYSDLKAASIYFRKEALLDSVASGAIRPLKGRYIVELDERGGRLQRQQDLPPEAFWTAAELEHVARALGDDFGMLFVALSYRWLKKGDPGACARACRV